MAHKQSNFELHLRASEMSEYELLVLQKRQEKEAFLESLKIDEMKQSFQEAVHTLKPKPKPFKNIKRPNPHPTENVIRRKSLRLSKLSGIDLSERALEIASKAEEAVQVEKIPETLPFEGALKGGEVSENFVKEFGGMDYKTMKPYNDYVSQFKNMTLKEDHIAKVVDSRITALAVNPSTDRIIVCAASKYGNIGFWIVDSDSNPFVFKVHYEGITDMKFNPLKTNLIVSSSYDGTLCCADLETKVFQRVFDKSETAICTSFDFLSSSTYLVSHQDGNVSIVDTRSSRKPSEKQHHCHDHSVKTVSIHPVNQSYFITSDNKGKIRLWDLRRLQKLPLVEVHQHKRSISSAYFSPLTGKYVLSTSLDDTICIFDSSNLGKSLTFENKLRHNNQTGRWLSTFKATWLPNSDDTFVVGSMSHPRRIEIFDHRMDNIYDFIEEQLSSITSRNVFHPSLPLLAGGNSSGKVFVFSK